MGTRVLGVALAAAVAAPIALAGQAAPPASSSRPAARPATSVRTSYQVPRTPWGHPDLQGTWDYRTITPLERPQQYGDREFYTDAEVKEMEARAAKRMDEPPAEDAPAATIHPTYWTDPGRFVAENRRT